MNEDKILFIGMVFIVFTVLILTGIFLPVIISSPSMSLGAILFVVFSCILSVFISVKGVYDMYTLQKKQNKSKIKKVNKQ